MTYDDACNTARFRSLALGTVYVVEYYESDESFEAIPLNILVVGIWPPRPIVCVCYPDGVAYEQLGRFVHDPVVAENN